MTALPFPEAPEPDAAAEEAGRRLFAGGAEFLKGVVAMSGLSLLSYTMFPFSSRASVVVPISTRSTASLTP